MFHFAGLSFSGLTHPACAGGGGWVSAVQRHVMSDNTDTLIFLCLFLDFSHETLLCPQYTSVPSEFTHHANSDGFTTQHANADGFTTQHANADGFTTQQPHKITTRSFTFGYIRRTR